MRHKGRARAVTDLKRWLLAGTFVLVVLLVIVGVVDERIDLTAVALSLVGLMGILTNSLRGDSKKDEP